MARTYSGFFDLNSRSFFATKYTSPLNGYLFLEDLPNICFAFDFVKEPSISNTTTLASLPSFKSSPRDRLSSIKKIPYLKSLAVNTIDSRVCKSLKHANVYCLSNYIMLSTSIGELDIVYLPLKKMKNG